MIPRHLLPFGPGRVLAALLSPSSRAADLERAFAERLRCWAVLVPSVRAGLHMALAASGLDRSTVVAPAYTCDAVFEGLSRSGASVRALDAGPGSFLMAPAALAAAVEPDCAVVLSEVYGLGYPQTAGVGAALRLLDLAMSVPSHERVAGLESRDVALYSFAWGKPMFAGWGGVACFASPELAGRVRDLRDAWATPESAALRAARAAGVLLRSAANQRLLHGLSHHRWVYTLARGLRPSAARAASTERLSARWTRPTTPLNRALALANLAGAEQQAELRLRQAEAYAEELGGPGTDGLPQSHFPIRVPAGLRDRLCYRLRGRGIDAGTLFPLPSGLDPVGFPNAAAAAAEVVTLPLGPGLSLEEVRRVACWVGEVLVSLGAG